MRHLPRKNLDENTNKYLNRLTDRVTAAQNPKKQAESSWKRKGVVSFGKIRSKLAEMASSRSRCMYCEDSHGTDIDHFWPKSVYPEKAFLWENYLLACSYCNSNQKRQEFPLDQNGTPLLIDPTKDTPHNHLTFTPTTGKFIGSDEKGSETIRVFGLNDDDSPRKLPAGRRNTLINLTALLIAYDQKIKTEPDEAEKFKAAITETSFSHVLYWLIDITSKPGAELVITKKILDIIQNNNVATWIN